MWVGTAENVFLETLTRPGKMGGYLALGSGRVEIGQQQDSGDYEDAAKLR